ncbi:unnamed protein product [Citrullus colocynthis]|uniref:Uncharacterized protein n=1 Tax=Citrullus colocynthis TaxID=252529 RepID=A0ABP0Z5T0_9ROSI
MYRVNMRIHEGAWSKVGGSRLGARETPALKPTKRKFSLSFIEPKALFYFSDSQQNQLAFYLLNRGNRQNAETHLPSSRWLSAINALRCLFPSCRNEVGFRFCPSISEDPIR